MSKHEPAYAASRDRLAAALKAWRRLRLGNVTVRRLLVAVLDAEEDARQLREWPSEKDEHTRAAHVAKLAAELAKIAKPSPRMHAELQAMYLRTGSLEALLRLTHLPRDLGMLAMFHRKIARRRFRQARPQADWRVVAAVAKVTGWAPSLGTGSKFLRAVEAAFAALGKTRVVSSSGDSKPRDARPAIRAYLAKGSQQASDSDPLE